MSDDDGFNTDDLDAFLDAALITQMAKPIAALFKAFCEEGLSRRDAAFLAIRFLTELGDVTNGPK